MSDGSSHKTYTSNNIIIITSSDATCPRCIHLTWMVVINYVADIVQTTQLHPTTIQYATQILPDVLNITRHIKGRLIQRKHV